MSDLSVEHLSAGALPALLDPASTQCDLGDVWRHRRELIDQLLLQTGGVLLRGFDVPSVADFQAFAKGYGHPLLNYEFADAAQRRVNRRVHADRISGAPAHPAA